MLNRFVGASLVVAVALLVGGCSNDFSGDRYSSRNAGEVARTDHGTVVSMRKVEIKPEGGPGAGALLGAAGGGLLGSAFGGGRGKLLTTAVGAVAGGVAGNAIQNRAQDGIEYVVKLDTGSTITLAQGPSPAISVGQRVYVINSSRDRSRIVPE